MDNISETVRRAAAKEISRTSCKGLARRAEMQATQLKGFVEGTANLRSDVLDRLAAVCGVRVHA